MTSKEFRMWLEGFLTNLNLDNMNIRSDINPRYNSLTMLSTINNKIKEVKDIEDFGIKGTGTLLNEQFTPTKPPNPFEIIYETKK